MIALLCGLLAHAEDTVTIRLYVPPEASSHTATATVRWLGIDRIVPLEPTETPGELSGEVSGDAVRMLPVYLDIASNTGVLSERAYRGLEMLPVGGGELVYSMDNLSPPRAHRIATTSGAGRDALSRREGFEVGGSLAWGCLMLVLVGVLVRRRPDPTPHTTPDWRWWWSLPIWAGLAVAWTWPAVNAGGGQMIGRHFDLPGVLWALDASGRLLSGGLFDTMTAWPVGGDYRRFDSFTLLPIGALFADLGADRIHGALQILGVFLLGFFGERFSRAVGAKGWWGLVGGAALALSGMSANVLLEGHVFHLLNPWLPLLGLTWWRATGSQSRWIWGALSGLFFSLCLLTTAYLGVAAAIVVACLAVPALRQRTTWPAMGAAAAVVVLLTIPYAALFAGGSDIAPGSSGHIVSANLVSLAGPTPELDRTRHSQAIALPGIVLALALMSPAILRGRRWILLIAAGVTAVMAMGSGLSPSEGPAWFPLPMALVEAAGGGSFLRFPMRLFWGTLLCLGALAAWGGTVLEARLGRGVRVLVLVALIEPFAHVRAPFRQLAQPSTTPSVYRQVDGPVLDLFPDGTTQPHELEQWFTRFACSYQRHHDNPIAEHCIATTSAANPRHLLDRWLMARLLEGKSDEVGRMLARMGFVGIALHPDLFETGDRVRISEGLTRIDPEPLYSTDGGELVVMYRLPSSFTTDPAAIFTALKDPTPVLLGIASRDATTTPTLSLQVELETLEIQLEGSYIAVIRPPNWPEIIVELSNDGRSSTDLPGDIAWVGHSFESMPSQFSLMLVRRGREAQEVLWSGPVQLHAQRERLAFRMQEDGTARPVITAPAFTSPPVGRSNDPIAAVGWIMMVLLGGGWWLVYGRILSRRPHHSAATSVRPTSSVSGSSSTPSQGEGPPQGA